MPPGLEGVSTRVGVGLVFYSVLIEQGFGIFTILIGNITFSSHGDPEELQLIDLWILQVIQVFILKHSQVIGKKTGRQLLLEQAMKRIKIP